MVLCYGTVPFHGTVVRITVESRPDSGPTDNRSTVRSLGPALQSILGSLGGVGWGGVIFTWVPERGECISGPRAISLHSWGGGEGCLNFVGWIRVDPGGSGWVGVWGLGLADFV